MGAHTVQASTNRSNTMIKLTWIIALIVLISIFPILLIFFIPLIVTFYILAMRNDDDDDRYENEEEKMRMEIDGPWNRDRSLSL